MKILNFTSHQVEDLSKTGVYAIVNTNNNRFYIGSAARKGKTPSNCGFYSRWTLHISKLKRNKHHCQHLQRSWNKHGSDCFEFRILEIVEPNLCIETEQEYLDFSDKSFLFNSCPNANSSLGRKHTKATKSKIAKSKVGNTLGEKTFSLVSPAGDVVKGINLKKFALDNNLSPQVLWSVNIGRSLHHKGWTASLQAHELYQKFYPLRCVHFHARDSLWYVKWEEDKRTLSKYFKDLAEAQIFRDAKEAELEREFMVRIDNWKNMLEKGVHKDG